MSRCCLDMAKGARTMKRPSRYLKVLFDESGIVVRLPTRWFDLGKIRRWTDPMMNFWSDLVGERDLKLMRGSRSLDCCRNAGAYQPAACGEEWACLDGQSP